MEDYDEAIRLDPSNADAYWARSRCWLSKVGWAGEAIRDAEVAIRLNPKNARWYCIRGAEWHLALDWRRAIRDFDEAVRLDPNDAFAFNRRGRVWYSIGEYDQAIEDFGEAVRLFPDNYVFWKDRGRAWLARKNFDQAKKDYDQAFDLEVRLKPNSASPYCWRAWLLATSPVDEVRDGGRAIELATTACELTHWRGARELEALAAAYAEAGRFDEAERYQRKALENPAIKGPVRDHFCHRLKLYEQRKPYRASP
jgi:tetratricopeptide (TPR) repeat protein